MLEKPNKDNRYLVKYLLSLFVFSNIMYKLLVVLFVIKYPIAKRKGSLESFFTVFSKKVLKFDA